jgi:hypothetical protein
MGSDPNAADNRWLRDAFENRVPVIYFFLSCGAGSAFADDVPDASKTPGLARSGLSKAKICATKWGKDERHVTAAMNEVFSLYGYSGYQDKRCMADAHRKTCEIDRLISRFLAKPGRRRPGRIIEPGGAGQNRQRLQCARKFSS